LRPLRILILGGTSEASALSAQLSGREDIAATVSLAGRTQNPVISELPTRIGGFGGVEGLRGFLRVKQIDAVIDATHPFAAQMSRRAAEACASENVALLSFTRPPWSPVGGDKWIEVVSIEAAVAALGEAPKRVLLTQGRMQLGVFSRAPQHYYVVRSIEPPEGLTDLPRHRLILARGPFDLRQEEALMREERVEILISKNSGGAATYAKIAAARHLAIPVVMLSRPELPAIERTHSLQSALTWIEAKLAPPRARESPAHRAPP